MNPFEKLASELKRLQTGYREESFYRPLSDFLEEYANNREFLHMMGVQVTNNPASESVGSGVGFPDIEVKQNRRLIGYIEVKPPTQNLDNPSFSNQFNRYKESLENVVFTNFKTWSLYSWNKDGKSEKIKEATWDYENDLTAEELKKLLTVFFEGESYQAKTPHQLAIALARKTKLLSQQVEDALTAETPEKRLVDLKKTFEKTLIQDIGDHQFANIYAETIAYSLFLAKLEHFEKGSSQDFTLRTAVDFLPKNVPIFRDLYQLTGGIVEPITPEIHNATEILIEQLNFADIEKIHKKLTEHKPGEDPVIQFYAPFLSEYDPEERKARGVYYTPKPVVDYIIRSVDNILKTKFDKSKGLGDESVQILDPATGTGTFLQSVIQNIYADIELKNKPLGEQAVQREFNKVVSNHILKHIYGFELLVAPYAVAHLKLTLELERLGFNFSMTEGDKDKDNDRLKIYLANTLDDPNQPPQSLFGFESIAEESERAREIKKDEPILVITGNPPYSNFGQMNRGKWILNLLEDYKKNLNERKINLDDDFIKFIKFAQWKLDQTGEGIFAMITSSTYIDGITHRQMRKSLMTSFDEVYIYNLHGSGRHGEKAPDGSKDENVFENKIQTGVSISFFLKYKEKKETTVVKYVDLWGRYKHKWEVLLDEEFEKTPWEELSPREPFYWFYPYNDSDGDEFESYTPITDIFKVSNNSGIQTKNNDFTYFFESSEATNTINDLKNLDLEGVKEKYMISSDTSGWSLSKARKDVLENQGEIVDVLFRPFDIRKTYYTGKSGGYIGRPRKDLYKQFKNPNLGLLATRQYARSGVYSQFFVTKTFNDIDIFNNGRGNASCFPFLINDDKDQQDLFSEHLKVNFKEGFFENFKDKIGEDTLKPIEVFCYIYGVFYSTTYRSRYLDKLRKELPRVPLTTDINLFRKISELGRQLTNAHLLGDNPFDKSKTIFDNTSKWHVKIGGVKPDDLDDWKVSDIRYDEKTSRVYVNPGQYFEGIEKEVWEFMVGGYQVLDKWLKDRKKAGRVLSSDDTTHYMKIVVSLRETIRIMQEIDKAIPSWPIK